MERFAAWLVRNRWTVSRTKQLTGPQRLPRWRLKPEGAAYEIKRSTSETNAEPDGCACSSRGSSRGGAIDRLVRRPHLLSRPERSQGTGTSRRRDRRGRGREPRGLGRRDTDQIDAA